MSFPKALWTRLLSNSQWLKNTNGDINISHNNHHHVISYSLFLPLNNAPGICLVLWGGENQIIFCNIHVFVFNTSINQSFVGLFNPFTGKTEGFPSLFLDESANPIWSLNKKPRRKGSKSSKALCFFSRGNHARVHKKAKLGKMQEEKKSCGNKERQGCSWLCALAGALTVGQVWIRQNWNK